MLTEELRNLLKAARLTKDDLKVILLDNFVKNYEDGELYLDLENLDFSDLDADIVTSGMKVKRNLYQGSQEVKGDIYQSCQRVKGDLFQVAQEVEGDLYQSYQEVKGNLYSCDSKTKDEK